MFNVKTDYATIEIFSLSEFASYGVDNLIKTLNLGGIYTVLYSKIEDLTDEQKSEIPPEHMYYYRAVGGKYVIKVVKEIFENLSDNSKKAIILHEEGHIVYNHLLTSSKTDNIVDFVDSEIEADAYAAERLGKEVMLEALNELFSLMAKLKATDFLTKPFNSEVYDNSLNKYLSNEKIIKRLEALR